MSNLDYHPKMMKSHSLRSRPRLLACIAVSSFALALCGRAQEAPVKQEAKNEIVRLSPFVVNTQKDTGYMGADVLTSSMMSTNLLRTPSDVTVLTRDFLDDIVAIDSIEAQRWLPSTETLNVQGETTNPTDFGTSTTFRGIGGGLTRNYWKYGFTPEAYMVDRIEGARGPNGILYGDASQGGKSNFVTKKPIFGSNFATVKLYLDSFSTQSSFGRGIYIDINRKISDELAVRLNLQDKAGPNWWDRSISNRYGGNLAVAYRPWHGANVTLEMEHDLITATTYRPDNYFDQLSLWDGTTTVNTAHGLTSNPAASTGIARLNAVNSWQYIAGVGTLNWNNMGQSRGTGISTLPLSLDGGRDQLSKFPVKPSTTFSMQSPLEEMESHETIYNFDFNQTFDNGLTINLGADHNSRISTGDTLYFGNTFVDVNKVLPNGQTNPNFGKRYSYSPGGWNPVRTADYYTGARAAMGYKLEGSLWGTKFTQTFSALVSWREEVHPFKAWNYLYDNGLIAPNGLTSGAYDTNLRVGIWRYWDDPTAPTILPQNDGVNKFKWIMSRDQHNTAHLRSMLIASVGSYFDDKLLVVAGIRRDIYSYAARDIQRRNPVTGDPTLAGPANGLFTDSIVNTPQVGLTYFPIKQIGIYANRSNGFNPSIQNVPKLDGSGPYNTAVSEGKSAGLRFNFLKGRLVGTVGYYDSFEEQSPSNQSLAQINNIWKAVGNAGGPDNSIVQTGGLAQYSDQLTRRMWGWEAEVTANLTRGLRLMANVALPHTKQMNSLPDSKAYYNDNVAVWKQYQSDSAVANAMQTFETNIFTNTADGRPLNGLYRYRANVYGNYTFQSGVLKDLMIGAGANFYGQQIIGSPTGKPFEFFHADVYQIVTASLGYKFKYREHPVSLNLTLTNLLNYQEPIYRQGGVAYYGGKPYFSQYYWPSPPQVKLTTSLRF